MFFIEIMFYTNLFFCSADEYIKEQPILPLHVRRESQVPKYLNLINKGGGNQGMERVVNHLQHIISKANVTDFQCFLLMDGLGLLASNVILKGLETPSEISKKYN